jgi:hypothetical protein
VIFFAATLQKINITRIIMCGCQRLISYTR